MKVTLNRPQIDLCIALGEQTLARYVSAYGHYNNTFNSHTKGRFGEVALEAFFLEKGCKVIPHFKNPASDRKCDLEVSPATFRRLEIKTWSESGWDSLGRCFSPKQSRKLREEIDAVVWCTVPLPNLNGPSDLDGYETLDVTLVGYSLPEDIVSAPISPTGEDYMRKVRNHQVDAHLIRAIEDIIR
jgi:hypothetical protein